MSSIIAQKQQVIRSLLGRLADAYVPVSHAFVLLPDIWLPGSSWDGVKAFLELDGHQVFTVELDGAGSGKAPQDLKVADLAAQVASVIGSNEMRQVYLVAAGTSGPVAQVLVTEHPQWFARVIFYNAFVPAVGESIYGLSNSELATSGGLEVPLALAELMNAETGLIPPPALSTFVHGFVPRFAPDEQERLYAGLHAQPVGPLMDTPDVGLFWVREQLHPYSLIGFHLPTTYIVGRQDSMIAPQFWESQAGQLPYCSRIRLEHAGHGAPYGEPLELAQAILTAVDGFSLFDVNASVQLAQTGELAHLNTSSMF